MNAKATHKADRATIGRLTDIVNVGKSIADDLQGIGVVRPQQLIGRDPWQLYCKICARDKSHHDPCLLDAILSAVDYMNGKPPRKWWDYTNQRKQIYADRLRAHEIRVRGSAATQRKK